MAWIKTVSDEEAEGGLKRLYAAAAQRTGRVFNIVRAMSLNPPVLKASMGIYQAIMYGESTLPRGLRELLATVVSRVNLCHY
ncbi:MAG: peroxidase [Phycisphaerae bacterium]